MAHHGGDASLLRQIQAEKNIGRYDMECFPNCCACLSQHADIEALIARIWIGRSTNSARSNSRCCCWVFSNCRNTRSAYRVVITRRGLAQTFGGTDGHKFVNGVLDKLRRNCARQNSPERKKVIRTIPYVGI